MKNLNLAFAIDWFKEYFAPTTTNLDPLQQYLRIRTEGVGRYSDGTKPNDVLEAWVKKLIGHSEKKHTDLNSKDVAQIFAKFFNENLKLSKQDKSLFQPTIFDPKNDVIQRLRKGAEKINKNDKLSTIEKEVAYTKLINDFLDKLQRPSQYIEEYDLIKKLFMTTSMLLISPHSKATPSKLVIGMPALVLLLGITSPETLSADRAIWVNVGAALLNYFYKKNEENGLIKIFSHAEDKNLKRLFELDHIEGIINNLLDPLDIIGSFIAEYSTNKIKENVLNRKILGEIARMMHFLSVFENHYEQDISEAQKGTLGKGMKRELEKEREEMFKKGFNKTYPIIRQELEQPFFELWKYLRTVKDSILTVLNTTLMVRKNSSSNLKRQSSIENIMKEPQKTEEIDIQKLLTDLRKMRTELSTLIDTKQKETLRAIVSVEGKESVEDKEIADIFSYWNKESEKKMEKEEIEDAIPSSLMLFQYRDASNPGTQTFSTEKPSKMDVKTLWEEEQVEAKVTQESLK